MRCWAGKSIIAVLLLLFGSQLHASLIAEHVSSITAALDQPTDVAVSQAGDIFSLNGVLGQVIVFSENGKRINSFGRPGNGRAELSLPMGISIQGDLVYVADTGNSRISVFDLKGKFIRHIRLKSDAAGDKAAEPVSLLLADNKVIWTDRRHHKICISKLDNGKNLNCWGGKGEADGQFRYPYQLVSDEQGYIFAVDVLNARVQAFAPNGNHFMNTGRFGVNTAGSLFRPNGLALNEAGQLLVSDAFLGKISVFENGRALGLLTDDRGENLVFKSPSSLTLHKDKLYVSDTLNNSIEIYRLKNADPEKTETGLLSKPQPGSSRKNCVSCHISWADNYTVLDHGVEQVTPVAHQRMCYSCHHGVVIDSRESVGHNKQHPDVHNRRENKKDYKEVEDEIAEEFPLVSEPDADNGELYCGSCHTPHKFETDDQKTISDEHNNSWMRESNKSGEICQQCHESKLDHVISKQRPNLGVNHPVGIYLKKYGSLKQTDNNKHFATDENLHDGLPAAMLKAGAMLNGKQQMICQSCHKVHGSAVEELTAIDSSDAEMCVQCHQRHDAEDLESARKKGVHPVNIELDKPVTINNREVRVVNCISCHVVHEGKPGTALLAMDNKNGELCNSCHEDYSKLVNTDHDLRLSADENRNRFDELPEHTGACGTCHSMHEAEADKLSLDATAMSDYTGDEEPLQRDRMCLNCHRKDGAADGSQIKYFSHPSKDLILRSDKNIMPLVNEKNEISEFGKIACITCHDPHRWSAHEDIEEKEITPGKSEKNASGNILSSFLRNKAIQGSFCKDCHGIETKIKYKYYHLELSRKGTSKSP